MQSQAWSNAEIWQIDNKRASVVEQVTHRDIETDPAPVKMSCEEIFTSKGIIRYEVSGSVGGYKKKIIFKNLQNSLAPTLQNSLIHC